MGTCGGEDIANKEIREKHELFGKVGGEGDVDVATDDGTISVNGQRSSCTRRLQYSLCRCAVLPCLIALQPTQPSEKPFFSISSCVIWNLLGSPGSFNSSTFISFASSSLSTVSSCQLLCRRVVQGVVDMDNKLDAFHASSIDWRLTVPARTTPAGVPMIASSVRGKTPSQTPCSNFG